MRCAARDHTTSEALFSIVMRRSVFFFCRPERPVCTAAPFSESNPEMHLPYYRVTYSPSSPPLVPYPCSMHFHRYGEDSGLT